MGMPRPLTRRISDLSVDALAVAHEIQCPLRRDRIIELLRRISAKANQAYTARLAARSIEDTGEITPWTERTLQGMGYEVHASRIARLEEVESRPLPAGTER